MEPLDNSDLITIGKFARLGGVSIKALRLYAKLGLLHPAVVNTQSRYRMYSRAQLPRLNRILLFKNAGFALADIDGQLSQNDVAALSNVRDSLVQRAGEIQRQLSCVEAELRTAQSCMVVVKRIPAMRVSSHRRKIDSYDEADSMLRNLAGQLPRSNRLASGAIWHDCGNRTGTIDCEAFWILNRTACAVAPKELAPVTVAAILHEGDESTIGATYETARRWIVDNRFRIVAPNREMYLETEPSRKLTEIQFPIGNR